MTKTTNNSTLAEYTALIIRVGLTSFGGGLSGWMLRLVVHERHWLTEAEFLNGVGLCQVFPGINVLNLAIWLGYRLHGNRGAIAGALAMIIPPGIVIIALYVAFTGLSDNPIVRAMLDGVAAAAIGLSASMGLRAASRALKRKGRPIDLVAAILLALTFGAVGLAQLPLIPVVLVLVPISVAIAWQRTRPA